MSSIQQKGLILLILAVLPILAFSQPTWVNQGRKTAFSIEVGKPNFDGSDNSTTLSSALFFSLRLSLTNTISLVGELPVAHGEFEFQNIPSNSNTKIGNPYAGFEFYGWENSDIWVDVGLRIPVVSSNDDATFVGFFADPDRFEAFNPDLLALLAIINYREHFERSGLFFRLRGGISAFLNTDDSDGSDLHIIFQGFAGYDNDRLRLEGGLTGRLLLNKEGTFRDRAFLQAGANLSYAFGALRPGVMLRAPIDKDLREVIDYALGLNLEIQLGK